MTFERKILETSTICTTKRAFILGPFVSLDFLAHELRQALTKEFSLTRKATQMMISRAVARATD